MTSSTQVHHLEDTSNQVSAVSSGNTGFICTLKLRP
ncbi:hypothetical protein OESDEN_09122 [Oesophagostomum dentatum]|uniref:Uncharacterized protein n=1 Tax=Oesophagostomum dentatum TaxID=61180 RepID=A0A0B1T5G0_OESDE|nr:hypothetical protein OESDEN_09122 [Oesophagostomum dentatum]